MTGDWDKFEHLLKRLEVPAKTVLLREGEVSKMMFFLEKGCLRTWLNNDGKEITTQFFFEGTKVSSIESFITNQPSLYSIESIEPCILQTISQKDFQDVLEHSPEIKEEMYQHLFRRFLNSQKHSIPILKIILKNDTRNFLKNILILSGVFPNIT